MRIIYVQELAADSNETKGFFFLGPFFVVVKEYKTYLLSPGFRAITRGIAVEWLKNWTKKKKVEAHVFFLLRPVE